MASAMNTVAALRRGAAFLPDKQNGNRYCIVAKETDKTKTAYCFAVPIYRKDGTLTDLRFSFRDGAAHLTGSNSNVTVNRELALENGEGICRISLPDALDRETPSCLSAGGLRIFPSYNGVLISADCRKKRAFSFSVSVGHSFYHVRENEKYFALMSAEFRPFLTVSCTGASDPEGQLLSPAAVRSEKCSDTEYRLTLTPCGEGDFVWAEINLYDDKLIQDTTVETAHPKTNNAFGGMAFLGNTDWFGEQWLYTRPDFSKLPELQSKRIHRVTLHLPCYRGANTALYATGVEARFCSFGSTWEQKKKPTEAFSISSAHAQFQSIDITKNAVDPVSKVLSRTDGLILRTKGLSGTTAVATGDNYSTPQILEIQYH